MRRSKSTCCIVHLHLQAVWSARRPVPKTSGWILGARRPVPRLQPRDTFKSVSTLNQHSNLYESKQLQNFQGLAALSSPREVIWESWGAMARQARMGRLPLASPLTPFVKLESTQGFRWGEKAINQESETRTQTDRAQ